MKRLLIGGRLDGQRTALQRLVDLTHFYDPDAILVGGLWCGGHRTERKVSPEQTDFYRQLFQTLKKLNRPTMVLPGEHDVPMADFIRIVMMAEIENDQLHCVHATPHVEAGIQFLGVGGDLNEVIDTWNDRLRSSRAASEYYLRHLSCSRVPHSILLLTTPVAGPIGTPFHSDIAGDEYLASEIIHSCHPEVAVALGETDCRGMRRIAGTRVINPGRLSDGSAALLDLQQPERVEFTSFENAELVG